MRYFEKNGYKISSLTLGTVQLGLAYGINNSKGMPTYEESSDLLSTALDEGIVSFDTARSYGESEVVLGKYFKEEKREHTLISKAFFTGIPHSEVKDRLFTSVRETLDRLAIDKLPFLKLHNDTMLLEYGDTVIRALHDLKDEGLVSGIGVSFSDKSKINELCDGAGFDCVQLPANMLDNGVILDGTLERLEKSGTVVFVRSIYLQGLFFKNTDELPDKIKCAKEPLDKLHTLARDAGIGMAEMAVAFMKDAKGISSIVLGCDNPGQLKETAALVSNAKISDSLRKEIMEISESIPPIVIRPWEWFK